MRFAEGAEDMAARRGSEVRRLGEAKGGRGERRRRGGRRGERKGAGRAEGRRECCACRPQCELREKSQSEEKKKVERKGAAEEGARGSGRGTAEVWTLILYGSARAADGKKAEDDSGRERERECV